MKHENFKTTATNLLRIYQKNNQTDKVKFIKTLIDYQDFFGVLSIFNYSLLLRGHYSENTVKSVLSDLNCSLSWIKHSVNYTFFNLIPCHYTIIKLSHSYRH